MGPFEDVSDLAELDLSAEITAFVIFVGRKVPFWPEKEVGEKEVCDTVADVAVDIV